MLSTILLPHQPQTTSWVWEQMQRFFTFLPSPLWVKEFVTTKNSIVHLAFLMLIGLVAWQAHTLQGLDSSSLLYTYVSGDEVGEGPLDPSAYAKADGPGTGGPRLAAVESSDGPFLTFDDPEVNFAQTLDGSAVVAPTNPMADQPLPSDTPKASQEPSIYTIQDGDTIAGIARKFSVSTSTILWANGLSGNDVIKVGDHLTILPTSGVLHVVKSGDTVLALAQKYDTEAKQIIAYNRLDNEATLSIGETLIIPGGAIAAPQPTPRIVPRNTRLAGEVAPDAIGAPAASMEESSAGLIWPTITRHISQYFSGARRGHTGIDIDNRSEPGIFAAAAGTVQFQGWLGGYGNLLIVNHGSGISTYYAHLSKFYVSKGDNVKQGETIAKMGSTGHSTGPHVHFEVRRKGVPINPLGMY